MNYLTAFETQFLVADTYEIAVIQPLTKVTKILSKDHVIGTCCDIRFKVEGDDRVLRSMRTWSLIEDTPENFQVIKERDALIEEHNALSAKINALSAAIRDPFSKSLP